MRTATAMSPVKPTNQPCAGPLPTSAVPVFPPSPGTDRAAVAVPDCTVCTM